jgi:superfamily II DNA or RNA helicase
MKTEATDERSLRQIQGVEKWVGNRACGTLEWATGVGKTRAGLIAIKLARRTNPNRKIIIVVPRIPLKLQWEKILTAQCLQENTEVWVINSLIKKSVIDCDFLILDEIHRYAAKTFAKVFNVIRMPEKFILGLTATLKRTDGKHAILKTHAPIVDTISMIEALRKGYVSAYREYNLGVEMTEEAYAEYRSLAENYGYFSGKFGGDFDLIKECCKAVTPKLVGNQYYEPKAVQYARSLGWTGHSAYTAYHINMENQGLPRRAQRSVWGNDDHPYAPKKLFIWALQSLRYIRKIREFTCGYFAKTDVAEQIIRAFNTKTITFGEIIAPAEDLKRRLGDSAVMYHSKMSAKAKKEALKSMEENPAISTILTARSLDEGADLPEVVLGLELSRSSSETQYIQRLGRVIRKFLYDDGRLKVAIFVHIYLIDTKDYQWLMKSQKPTRGTQRWIKSVEELLRAESLIEA